MPNRKLIVEVVGDDRHLSRTFDHASKSSRSFGKDIERAGRGAAVATVGFRGLGRSIAFASGAFLGGAGFVAGSRAVVNAASDLNEQINKSQVVFGDSAAEIKAWSSTTAGALGLSQRASLEAAGGFGQLLETAGLTEPVAAKFSKTLVGLAADMASFNNIDPAEALLKLKSGLAGEAEPLRTVGVLLSETRVKQEAYASGIAKTGEDLTEGQKVQARYNLILKDTAKQQGDFARTSDSFANAQRIVRANFENLAAQIGSKVLPAIARATTAFGGFLTKLTEAEGFHAKLDVVLDAGRNLLEQGLKVAAQIRESVGTALEQIDWRQVGQSISRGLVRALGAIAEFVRSVDWGQVGQAVVRGIVDFLKGVDWVGLFKAIVRLWLAALKAQFKLLKGAGKELMGALRDGLQEGARIALLFVEKWALELIAKLVGAFGFLGRFNPFKGVEEKIKASLVRIQADIDALHGKDVEVTVTALSPEEHGRGGAKPTTPKTTVTVPPAAAVTAGTRAGNTAGKAARTAFEKAFAKLDIQLDIAGRTKSLQDDLRILKQQEQVITARLKVTKNDLDLQKQLVSVQNQRLDIEKQIAENRSEAVKRRQFAAIGLTAEGEERTPGSGSLLKRARSLQDQVKGTVLDTPKTRKQLKQIVDFLKSHLKNAKKEIREAILDMLNGISSTLDGKDAKRGPLTSTHGLATAQIIKNLGLTVEQAEEIQRRLANVTTGGGISKVSGTGGVRPGSRTDSNIVVESHITLNVDGQKMANLVERQQQKKKRRNPKQKRGPNRR